MIVPHSHNTALAQHQQQTMFKPQLEVMGRNNSGRRHTGLPTRTTLGHPETTRLVTAHGIRRDTMAILATPVRVTMADEWALVTSATNCQEDRANVA